jgi:hypothetical protein
LDVDSADASTAATLTVSASPAGKQAGPLTTLGNGMFNGTLPGPDELSGHLSR